MSYLYLTKCQYSEQTQKQYFRNDFSILTHTLILQGYEFVFPFSWYIYDLNVSQKLLCSRNLGSLLISFLLQWENTRISEKERTDRMILFFTSSRSCVAFEHLLYSLSCHILKQILVLKYRKDVICEGKHPDYYVL